MATRIAFALTTLSAVFVLRLPAFGGVIPREIKRLLVCILVFTSAFSSHMATALVAKAVLKTLKTVI